MNEMINELREENARLREEMSTYQERLREAIQSERKRWAKEDAEALRVRDIEQQIKVLEIMLGQLGALYERDAAKFEGAVNLRIEQLRKELE